MCVLEEVLFLLLPCSSGVNKLINVSFFVTRASCLATLIICITNIGRDIPVVLSELNSPSVVKPTKKRFEISGYRFSIVLVS